MVALKFSYIYIIVISSHLSLKVFSTLGKLKLKNILAMHSSFINNFMI